MIARLSDLLFRTSNDVRGVGKHASMVQTQLEQVAKSQNDFLNEINSNMNDHVVRVMTRGGRMTQEPLYPKGQPKRIEQNSQRINTDAASPSKKKKKKKNDRTLHASSEPEIEKPPDNEMKLLPLMLKLSLVMNTHLLIMKKIMMRFMKMLKQIIKNQTMMLR